MNLFIDTPQRAASRLERERHLRDQQARALPHHASDPRALPHVGPSGSNDATASADSLDFDLDEAAGFERVRQQSDAPVIPRGEQAPSRGKASLDAGSAQSAGSGAPPFEPYSIAADSYAQEKAFDKQRMLRRKLVRCGKVLAFMMLTPVALAAVFLVSYALTCVVNGASPEELVVQMGDLFTRLQDFLAAWKGSV